MQKSFDIAYSELEAKVLTLLKERRELRENIERERQLASLEIQKKCALIKDQAANEKAVMQAAISDERTKFEETLVSERNFFKNSIENERNRLHEDISTMRAKIIVLEGEKAELSEKFKQTQNEFDQENDRLSGDFAKLEERYKNLIDRVESMSKNS